ncbi:DnaJ-domain-containing protein [Thozetella sp. PMI_491]|nr:DnaJ-domain-containing protein [Thozetella sp. PMI_491]
MSQLPPDPWQVLGVSKSADKAVIRTAYKKLVLKCHPDKVKDPALKAEKQDLFQKVQQAYELLNDDSELAKYEEQVTLEELRRQARKNPNPSMTRDPPRREYSFRGQSSSTTTRYKDAARSPTLNPALPKEMRQKSADTAREQAQRVRSIKRAPGVLVTKGLINGHQIAAIPDTGAGYNMIAAAYAEELGIDLPSPYSPEGKPQTLRMANGRTIKTSGTVTAEWVFASDDAPAQRWKLGFHVLADFIYDLVLCNEFLRASETMSKHTNRLSRVPRPLRVLQVLFVNNLGPVNQRLLGTLNGDRVEALPDSGSEPNLLSTKYVMQRDWLRNVDTSDVRLLQFADGSVQRTGGSVVVNWEFRTPNGRVAGSVVAVEFHLLSGAVYDAIIGQDVLEDTDAFSRYTESFEDVKDAEPAGLNLVIWLPTKKKDRPDRSWPSAIHNSLPTITRQPQSADSNYRFQFGRGDQSTPSAENHPRNIPRRPPTPPVGQNTSQWPSATLRPGAATELWPTDIYVELQRRAAADRNINRMPRDILRDAAEAEERARRQEFDSRETGARVPGRRSSSSGGSSSPSIPSTSSSGSYAARARR